MSSEVSFPRQYARTQRFTLGVPRSFTVAPDGKRIVFLRAPSGTDRVTCLWVYEPETGRERRAADLRSVFDPGTEHLSPEEKARRERLREGAGGIVGYATDEDVRTVCFALSGRLFVADLSDGQPRELAAEIPVLDPRLDPTGTRIAYVSGGALRVVGVNGTGDRQLAAPDGPDITWGLAEFVAAEEMGRLRGFWWAPDGERLIAARVDESPVRRWYLSDPASPDQPPREVRYPAAGTANAIVSAWIVTLEGERVEAKWDKDRFPYLASVHWSKGGPPLLLVQSRDQRSVNVLSVDPKTGTTTTVLAESDPCWVDIVSGAPAWTPDGRLVWVAARDGAYRLLVDGKEWTDDRIHVASVIDVGEDSVLVSGWTDDPTEFHVFTVTEAGLERLSTDRGIHSAARRGRTTILVSSSLDSFGRRARVLQNGEDVGVIGSHAETPVLTPDVRLLRTGDRELAAALVLPEGHEPGSGPLPVILDPYGGPATQRVVAARNAYLVPQWLANQGFAVVVADGRGTPGRGPDWDRTIYLDIAGPNLEDQVEALHETARRYPDLDLSRVAIRGWSHGGWLAALAVLRRPDVFHAAIAGAPVTDERLYDTHYTERYLGHPDDHPEVYERNSLIADAPRLERPLLLIHGMSDDNVVVAHTLRLSSALLAAGRPHTVMPLCGVTHMTPQEVVAENLLNLEIAFLRTALGIDVPGTR